MIILKTNRFPLLLLFFLLTWFNTLAQKRDTLRSKQLDSNKTFVAKMQEFARNSARKSATDFEDDKAVAIQNSVFDEVRITMQKAKAYLRTSVDTVGTKSELKEIEADLKVAGDGVFTEKGSAQTFRNLTATSKILHELLNKAKARKANLDHHQQQLNGFRYRLDSLISVPALFRFPTDSSALVKYLQKIATVAYEMTPIDSALKLANGNVQTLLNQVNLVVSKLQINIEEIEVYQKEMAVHSFRRDFGNLWSPASQYRSFGEIAHFSIAKGIMTLLFYAENNLGKLIILFLLVLISFIYLRSLKRIYAARNLLKSDFEGQLVLRYPIASAIILVISLFQFIFLSPPFILSVIFWLICCFSLTIIFKDLLPNIG